MRRNSRGFRQGPGSNRSRITEESELKDLDLELQLLRRKRELLEQKVQNEQYHSLSNNHNFSYLYEDSNTSRPNYGKQPVRKRPSVESDWHAAPPKRASRSQLRKNNARRFDDDYEARERFDFIPLGQNSLRKQNQESYRGKTSTSNQSNYKHKAAPLMSFNSKPFIGQRIVDNQSIKPKQKNFQPTKVTKHKPGDANKVTPGFKHGTVIASQALKAEEKFPILRADKIPTQQMAGRLELALGNIMKAIKLKYSDESLYTIEKMRCMKNIIRQRIRKVMIGKPVGVVSTILDHYRNVYPEHTDVEIVAAAKAVSKEEKGKLTFNEDILDPQKYFKQHMAKLMDLKLSEMFSKLRTLYAEENGKDIQPLIDAALKDNSGEIPKQNVTDKEHNDFNNIDKDISLDNIDSDQTTNECTKPYYLEKLMMTLLTRKLPQALYRYKRNIIHIMELDRSYEELKADIIGKTGELIKKYAKTESDDEGNNKETEENENYTPQTDKRTTETHPQARLPYYVKIVGRPALPKRNAMQIFLDEYDPKSIKKVKHLRNLLFVGFDNKDNFDKIVKASNTVIGNNKLIIKISKWVTKEALDAPNNNQISNSQTENIGDSSFQSIDDQINNLLTSIRRDEEANEISQGEKKESADESKENSAQDIPEQLGDSQSNEINVCVSEKNDASQGDQSQNPDENTGAVKNANNELESKNKVENENYIEGANDAGDANNAEQENNVEGENDAEVKSNVEVENDAEDKNNVKGENDTKEENNAESNNEAEVKNNVERENYVGGENNAEDENKDINEGTQSTNVNDNIEIETTNKDKLNSLMSESKDNSPAISTRSSSRIANVTQSTIRTRQARRLTQDN